MSIDESGDPRTGPGPAAPALPGPFGDGLTAVRIGQAAKGSVDTLPAAADLTSDGRARAVMAVGCMAERYGREPAESLPEADADVATLADSLTAARLDAIGVFGYSDETDTEAAGMTGKISENEIEARRAETADLADDLADSADLVGRLVDAVVLDAVGVDLVAGSGRPAAAGSR